MIRILTIAIVTTLNASRVKILVNVDFIRVAVSLFEVNPRQKSTLLISISLNPFRHEYSCLAPPIMDNYINKLSHLYLCYSRFGKYLNLIQVKFQFSS